MVLIKISRSKTDFSSRENEFTVIGYFGFIKCHKSILLLDQICDIYDGKLRITLIAGHIWTKKNSRALKIINDSPNIILNTGPYFNSPEDLPSLYNNIDILWVATEQGRNTKWARNARIYEGLKYQKPMIFLKNTPGEKINDIYRIGITINFERKENFISVFDEFFGNLDFYKKNISKVPAHIFTLSNEHVELADNFKLKCAVFTVTSGRKIISGSQLLLLFKNIVGRMPMAKLNLLLMKPMFVN